MVPNPTGQRLHAERDCTARTYECLLPLEYLLPDGGDNQPTIADLSDGGNNQPTIGDLSDGGDNQQTLLDGGDNQQTIEPGGGDRKSTIDSEGGDNQPTIRDLSGEAAGAEEAATQAADATNAH